MPLSAYLSERLAYRSPEGALLPALADEAPPALRLLDHIGQAMRWYLPTSADTATRSSCHFTASASASPTAG